MYCIIKVVASDKAHPWNQYVSKHLGRYKFQMDLATDLIGWGISMDWSDVEDINTRPVYVRKQDWIPCGCMNCFFCKKGLTSGVNQMKKRKSRRSRSGLSGCPIKRAHVTPHPRRCVLCIKNHGALNPTLEFSQVELLCKQTRLGCTTCEVPVCAECWNSSEHHATL
jgi:hypothetical protein